MSLTPGGASRYPPSPEGSGAAQDAWRPVSVMKGEGGRATAQNRGTEKPEAPRGLGRGSVLHLVAGHPADDGIRCHTGGHLHHEDAPCQGELAGSEAASAPPPALPCHLLPLGSPVLSWVPGLLRGLRGQPSALGLCSTPRSSPSRSLSVHPHHPGLTDHSCLPIVRKRNPGLGVGGEAEPGPVGSRRLQAEAVGVDGGQDSLQPLPGLSQWGGAGPWSGFCLPGPRHIQEGREP